MYVPPNPSRTIRYIYEFCRVLLLARLKDRHTHTWKGKHHDSYAPGSIFFLIANNYRSIKSAGWTHKVVMTGLKPNTRLTLLVLFN